MYERGCDRLLYRIRVDTREEHEKLLREGLSRKGETKRAGRAGK